MRLLLVLIFSVLAVLLAQCSSSRPEVEASIDGRSSVGMQPEAPQTDPGTVNTGSPVSQGTPEGRSLPECAKEDCNCSDFLTQAEAQAVLDAFAGDPHNLDKNKDGVACESLP